MSDHPEQNTGADLTVAAAGAGLEDGGSSAIPGHHPGALAAVASSAGQAERAIPSLPTPEGDLISRGALPNVYYECTSCTSNGSEGNCRPAEEIRLAPSGEWMCEYCYDDAAYEDGEFGAGWPVWSDLPKLSDRIPASQAQGEEGADEWLIYKAGRGWYRPNAQGYTSNPAEAGRYSLTDALSYSHPNGWDGPRDEITIKRVCDVIAAPAPVSAGVDLVRSLSDLLACWDMWTLDEIKDHLTRYLDRAALRTPPPAWADGEGGEG